jgi:Family of unknown function (DUF6116)
MSNVLTRTIHRYAGGLRYPTLLAIAATVFAIDLVVPDLIPFVDEILLGLGTLILAGLRKRKH